MNTSTHHFSVCVQYPPTPANYGFTEYLHHAKWSENGTWEQICHRLAERVRQQEGRGAEPSAGIIDARSVRGASTVTRPTRGYDAGKKISGRKTFGVVDTIGILMAVIVVAASV
jgi:putative transposase